MNADSHHLADHDARMQRALRSLEGLAIGDALGEMLSYRHAEAAAILQQRLPPAPWFHTDDTEMALAIVEVLKVHGHVDQEALARRFAWRFERDPDRGYGSMTRAQLNDVLRGAKWQDAARNPFSGQGSMGNGAAMRVAPLGAYFADDFARVAEQARASAEVTHTHPEGVAGAVAVAIAAASAARARAGEWNRDELFAAVLEFTPESQVRCGLVLASQTPASVPVNDVARTLGNGFRVTAPDTVPFAIWCAAQLLPNYAEAVISTITTGGDCDTNAAIVGGIMAASWAHATIPEDWKASYERLPFTELYAG
jgi:ADP-ribosylglycohydrolase